MDTMLLQCCFDTVKNVKCGCGCAATRMANPEVAHIVCGMVVVVTGLLVGGFLQWKLMECLVKVSQANRQRGWNVEDRVMKQKAELTDKKLAVLKENCYKTNENELNPSEVGKYVAAIDDIIKNK